MACILQYLQLREYIDNTEDYINIQVSQLARKLMYDWYVVSTWILLGLKQIYPVKFSAWQSQESVDSGKSDAPSSSSGTELILVSKNCIINSVVIMLTFVIAVRALSQLWNRVFSHLLIGGCNIWYEHSIYMERRSWIHVYMGQLLISIFLFHHFVTYM